MNRARRGYALLLALVAFAALAAIAAAVWVRLSIEPGQRIAGERRSQILWLARSAADSAHPQRTVTFEGHTLQVSSRAEKTPEGTRVTAEAGWEGVGAAHVQATWVAGQAVAWTERYHRAEPAVP